MELGGALIGCGRFAENHLHGWAEVDGARIAAVCDLEEERAVGTARRFGIERAYTSAREMLETEDVHFVDVVTQPNTHRELVELAARCTVPVVCQKPMATSLEDACAMVEACRASGIPFMVHENFRWQAAMRVVKERAAAIGDAFFGRICFRSAYDVYARQPYLAEDERFIIYDLGVHLLDLARYFMGEVVRLHAHTLRVNPRINGEDVATILLEMKNGGTCVVELSYASVLEEEIYPQTLVHLEGPEGSVILGPHYEITTVSASREVTYLEVPPVVYRWSTPPAEVVQASVVSIQQHWVDCLREGVPPDTSGADNLRTLELVFGAYASAERGEAYDCITSLE